jgi:hypothetical protein
MLHMSPPVPQAWITIEGIIVLALLALLGGVILAIWFRGHDEHEP